MKGILAGSLLFLLLTTKGNSDGNSSDTASNVTFSDPGSNLTFSNPGSNVTFSDPGSNATFSDPGSNVTFSDPGSNVTFSDPGNNLTFSDPGSNVTFSDPCSNVTFSDPGSNITFSDPGSNVTFSDPCSNETFSDPCSNRTFRELHSSGNFSDPCSDANFSDRCSDGIGNFSCNVSTFCVDLPIHNGNRTFCGIETKSKPRISEVEGAIAASTPIVFSWGLTLLVMISLRKVIKGLFENEAGHSACIGYLLFYGKLIWDAVDVTVDSYLFYQLEFGQAIDENITRNNYVTNSILAFAIIGSIKVLLFFIYRAHYHENDPDKRLKITKVKQLWFGFLLEDGPELILEYFFVEKFVSLEPPWYLLGRDIISAFSSLFTVISVLKYLCCDVKDFKSNFFAPGDPIIGLKFPRLFAFFTSLISALMFLRAGGAGYQFFTGDLERDCFNVQDGMLLQNPFSNGCLAEIDYAIIVLSCILLIPSIYIGFAGYCYAYHRNTASCDQP